MRRAPALAAAALAALALAAPAQAAFGIRGFEVDFAGKDEAPVTQAGDHPFAMTTSLGANFDEGTLTPEGWLRDFSAELPPGMVADTTAYPACTTAQFLDKGEGEAPACPPETQVGVAGVSVKTSGTVVWEAIPVFNVAPPPGVLLRLGFRIVTQNTFIDAKLNNSPPYNGIAASRNTPQIFEVFGAKIQIWGNPSSSDHDELRHPCGPDGNSPPPGDIEAFRFQGGGVGCPVGKNEKPLLTMPTNCSEGLLSSYEALSWEGDADSGFALLDPLTGCGKLTFRPSVDADPTNSAASGPSGLDFELSLQDDGLTSTTGLAASAMRKAVVTLPEGMTVNPSQAEGLEVCSEEDLEAETLEAEPGEGCPQAAKIGTVEVDSPLVGETLQGALFVAEPRRNLAGDSLIAVYLVVRNRDLGIIVIQPIRVDPDPRTGQLIATAEEVPQLPFSSFRLRFREGARSPLITPPRCGGYELTAELHPWSGAPPARKASAFEISSGPGGGPCPAAGAPPFEPGFEAGSQSNAAGAHSPFSMRLTRRDGDQDLTRFDATLPPGVGGILAGVERCADAQIAAAKAKTGKAELASPSCPPGSRLGGVLAGAGAGSQLTYVRGDVYLAGPFGGAPISVVAIVPAVAGPFDVGTVITRQALVVDPRTGQVSADGAQSDPIPHILQGIPLAVRDIQVHIDRPSFTYNPTSCDPFATAASIWGGGSQPFSTADDAPAQKSARFQAASCQSLGFKPRLGLSLRGATHRGAFPALRLVYRPRPADANLSRLALRFPRSEFIEQGHFRTICTRVQFAAGEGNGAQCPAGSVYGRARVFTPILGEPLSGPVFLRSSDNNLPDVVLALQGPPSLEVKLEVPTRIDSIRGGLRAIAGATPDAPVSKVIVEMQGGQKGLFVNSRELCRQKNRASARLTAHSAKRLALKPVVRAQCAKGRRGAKRRGGR
jgi:hypothetical protein